MLGSRIPRPYSRLPVGSGQHRCPLLLCLFSGRIIRNFDRETHKPPVRRFGDPSACHLAFEAQILRHIDPSELGDPDAMITQLALIIGKIETRFASLFAFEAWATCPSFLQRTP